MNAGNAHPNGQNPPAGQDDMRRLGNILENAIVMPEVQGWQGRGFRIENSNKSSPPNPALFTLAKERQEPRQE